MKLNIIIIFLIFTIISVKSISLDIHLNLDATTNDIAINYNDLLHKYAPNDQVFLGKLSIPHITLYLTDFVEEQIPSLQNELKQIFPLLEQQGKNCLVGMTTILVSGQYGMWEVQNSPCLQFLSDLIVNNTYQYITPNQTIPDWVYQLPEPLRDEKIAMIKKYGSPNVYDQFQPHVTLAWDEVDNLTLAFEQVGVQPTSFYSPSIGIGNTGPYGTVLDNQYGTLNFSTSS
ncbi:hypothetical protein DICPUDRAFT_160097 [Dictyostelium purpureum]|uniref:Uncharacterized protein n=1 Tax=Dictyostelium purpureum TaxID=5786 RepID=F1A5Q2_DICPU|nr:uncharacterized protein DICPUDRAFT_160097 [Dictyostelium purpureum]EGC28475.1 hypothetical protein DICPUDRAFT_160097 [Dictyostelium purpureum]|eukprot:XP_003294996.1 hypothetical protein DICPUDRAFT_160097 [Dictyostelium purpureum]